MLLYQSKTKEKSDHMYVVFLTEFLASLSQLTYVVNGRLQSSEGIFQTCGTTDAKGYILKHISNTRKGSDICIDNKTEYVNSICKQIIWEGCIQLLNSGLRLILNIFHYASR